MTVSRRSFLAGSAALAATAALQPTVIEAARPSTPLPDMPSAMVSTAVPSSTVVALNRMGYGPRPGDVRAVETMGLAAYVEQQLNPDQINDSDCDARIAWARMRMKYDGTPDYPACDELRPLATLDKPIKDVWYLTRRDMKMDGRERILPLEEVRAATWIRAVYSERQLKEVLVEFWHNHFNVYPISTSVIACTFAAYDREVIRPHCLGNFREFLEAVAMSTAMLYYLDNVSNKTSGGEGGNENFARELIELHTLGVGAYLDFYDDRRNIGTDGAGNALGYIDEDVYETARCFTGWTVANGAWNGVDGYLPNTGEFLYQHTWHDTASKTVLSPDGYPNIPRNQPQMSDGRRVLDLLARHPATARHLCTKLCRRFIADEPPAEVVEAAAAEWMAHVDSPDQIKRVMRVILLSEAFRTTWGEKIKRPFEAMVSYIRATGGELSNDVIDPNNLDMGYNWASLNWRSGEAGHRLYDWAAPDGYPDEAAFWVTTNGMLQRWKLPYVIMHPWGGDVVIDIPAATPAGLSCIEIVDFWIDRLCGFVIAPAVRDELILFMAQGKNPQNPPEVLSSQPDWGDPKALDDRLVAMVQLLVMSPDFQKR